MDVEFEDLVCKITPPIWNRKEKEKCILKSVSGRFKAGQLSAILGPSGAGKSTLLNSISGFVTKGVSYKSFKVNGYPRDEATFRKLSCYIVQEEILQPMLTVQEVMMFAADLKLPGGTSKKQKLQLIHDILTMLGLKECCVTRTERLSGGQKKRLSIALELINNPPVIFLDEPTSGLDNVSTAYTLKLLRRLAIQGRTIVCTIHQPSASIFKLFDHVYVLSQGQCVYQGPTHQLVPFLSSVGFDCPKHYNPADFVIELTDRDHEENIPILTEATRNGKMYRYMDDDKTVPYEKITSFIVENETNNNIISGINNNNIDTSLHKENNNNICYSTQTDHRFDKEYENLINSNLDPLAKYRDQDNNLSPRLLKSGQCNNVDDNGTLESKTNLCADFPTSWWTQFCTLWRRMTLQIYRNRIGLNIQFYHHLGCALALGIVFFDRARDGDDFFNHLKFCLGVALFHTFTYCMIPVITYPIEMKLLKREHFNRWYGLKPYYLAVQLARVPTMILFNMIFLSVVYVLTGLPREAHRFTAFCVVGILISVTAEGMGFFIGSLFNITNGSAVAPLTLAPFLGLATYGFDFAKDIPWYVATLMKMSFLRSGVVGVIIVVFGMNRKPLECLRGKLCLYKDPRALMQYLDLEFTSVWTQVGYLCLIMLFFRIGMYIALRWKLSR